MTTAPDLFSFDDVKHRVGETFVLRGRDGREIAIVLTEAKSLGFNRPGGRESFSLIFHAPAGSAISQGIHEFRHPSIGVHELFLVPLGPDAAGLRLQTIFNFN